jgi:hypothetical protein
LNRCYDDISDKVQARDGNVVGQLGHSKFLARELTHV